MLGRVLGAFSKLDGASTRRHHPSSAALVAATELTSPGLALYPYAHMFGNKGHGDFHQPSGTGDSAPRTKNCIGPQRSLCNGSRVGAALIAFEDCQAIGAWGGGCIRG